MRDLPGYSTDTDVLEPIARALHVGQDREVQGLTIDRSLPSSFHAQVRRVGGITQAKGTVEWAALSDVVKAQPTAFGQVGSWPPRLRDRVDVYAGYRTATGDVFAKQLTGAVESTTGDPQGSMESDVVDLIARLSRTVNLPPLLNNMPPIADGGPWRGVGLYPTFFTDRAARAGGFYSTPPASSGCVFSAPLMGSAWPESGTLVTGLRFSDLNNANARWHESPWGMGVSDCYLSYGPSGNTALTRAMEITAMAPAAPFVGKGYVAARWGSPDIRLNFQNSSVYGMVGGNTVCELPYVDGNVFSLRAIPNGGTVQLIVRDAAGREASGSTATPAGTDVNMSEVRVISEVAEAIIGGAQVAFPTTAWGSVSYARSAYITPAAFNASLAASPPIQSISARRLLEEQSEVELSPVWIDADGALQWRNRTRLLVAAPSLTLTSRDHVKALPWAEDFTGVSSQVEVSGRKPTVQQSKFNMVSMWEASQSGVEPGDTFEWLIHPDTDEDWVMVDLGVETLGVGASDTLDGFRRLNRGRDSWVAFYAENDAVGTNTWTGGSASAAFVDHSTYRVAAVLSPLNSTDPDWQYSMKIPSETVNGTVAGPMRSQPGLGTPVIRGRAKIMWEDVTAAATAGVPDAPALSHDVGWWVQDPLALQGIADLLAAETTTPRPYLRDVPIIPDARLERGDVITLSDPEITGIEFRCLVVGIRDTLTSEPSWEQSCDFRVIDYTRTTANLGDLDAAWAGQVLAALDAARAGDTLTQFDAQPLKGAPS